MIDVKKFNFNNFYSINPAIINKGNKLIVKTSIQRSCISLFSGYRCLEVNPDHSELILYYRSLWLCKYMARIIFNKIRIIEAAMVIYPRIRDTIDEPYQEEVVYYADWRIWLQLEDQGDKFPLFRWYKNLYSDHDRDIIALSRRSIIPSFIYKIAGESNQQKDYNYFLYNLSKLTGKSIDRFDAIDKISSSIDLSQEQSQMVMLKFKDPVAAQTEWTSIEGPGKSTWTFELVKVDTHKIEFRKTKRSKLLHKIFLIVPIGLPLLILSLYLLFYILQRGPLCLRDQHIFLLLLLWIIYAMIGCYALDFGKIHIIFDKHSGFFYKGQESPYEMLDKESANHFLKLEDIHALQLISKDLTIFGNRYELNLVLKDGKRINVIDYVNVNQLRIEAQTLSQFLKRPFWDAI